MMDATIHVWRCDGCGEMLPGPDLDLDMAKCKCKTGLWRVCCVAATIGDSAERARKADELAAANLAANKRIVELEHECNTEQRAVDALLESSVLLREERDAARAELARLTTPRPIAEAPRDGTWIVGFWEDAPPKIIRRWAEQWRDYMGAPVAWRTLTHYLPLPEVKP